MEHKSWLWKKKSSEKTILASNKASTDPEGIGNEKLNEDKETGSEQSLGASTETLASILYDSRAKDDLLGIHVKMAEDAIAGKEKAEAEAVALRQELDEAVKLGQAANGRLTQLDVELNECLQQLDSVRKDQDQRVQDAVAATSRDYEKAQKKLQEKFSETSKRLRNLEVESASQSMALQAKEKLIDELKACKSRSEAEFNALMERLDSTEKENSFLRYEFRMLEKELEIRSEEREFSRRSADALQKQHVESVKKITKLELECQRMRGLLRKRLPGPAEHPSKKISVLMERLSSMQEENKTLQEILIKRNGELQESKIMYEQLSSELRSKSLELARYSPVSNGPSLTSDFGISNDSRLFSNSGSWATALTSESEQIKHKNARESKRLEISDMSLMDDFLEMEKLAIVSVDTPHEINLTGKELVPVPQLQSSLSISQQETTTGEVSANKPHDWLQDVLKAILEENRVSNRSVSELLEDVRIALLYKINPKDKNASITGSTAHTEDYKEKELYLTMAGFGEDEQDLTETQKSQSVRVKEDSGEENELKFKEAAKKEIEERLRSDANKTETLADQLRKSEERAEKSQTELENLKASKGMIEDQLENQKSINEELDTQLAVARFKLNQALQKFLSLEAELENKSSCCEELEAACLELQLQFESTSKSEPPECKQEKEEKKAPTFCFYAIGVQPTCRRDHHHHILYPKLVGGSYNNFCSVFIKQLLLEMASTEPQAEINGTFYQFKVFVSNLQGWEVTTASAKLAECQETILNLGKQLKALSSPREAALFNKVFSTTNGNKRMIKRSLLDQMLAEDESKAEILKYSAAKNLASDGEKHSTALILFDDRNDLPTPIIKEPPQGYFNSYHKSSTTGVGSLAVVPSKKKGGDGGFLRRLLMRKKRWNSKHTSLTFGKV